MQGQMVGEYLLENYDTVDLNGDGVISYVMFKGQEATLRLRPYSVRRGGRQRCPDCRWQARTGLLQRFRYR